MSNVDLDRLDVITAVAANYTGLKIIADENDEESAVIDDRGTCIASSPWLSVARAFVAALEVTPALAAELRTLRARVAELERKGGE